MALGRMDGKVVGSVEAWTRGGGSPSAETKRTQREGEAHGPRLVRLDDGPSGRRSASLPPAPDDVCCLRERESANASSQSSAHHPPAKRARAPDYQHLREPSITATLARSLARSLVSPACSLSPGLPPPDVSFRPPPLPPPSTPPAGLRLQMSPALSADEFDDDSESPPLPTPTLPAFVDPGTLGVLSALSSFSFGSVPAFDSPQAAANLAKPVYPASSFPAYCLPRKGSSPSWDIGDLDDDDDGDEVNPSPVYGRIDADGRTLQTPGTPIAERERYDYPEFPLASSSSASAAAAAESGAGLIRSTSSDGTGVTSQDPIRPSPMPQPAPAGDRRGSISLPNVLTHSEAILPTSAPYAPLQPLHPASSPFAHLSASRRPSLATLAQHASGSSSSVSTLSRTRSQHRSSFSLDPQGSRASMSHIHPPLRPAGHPASPPPPASTPTFFPVLRTDAPVPPSLRNHPAFAHSVSGRNRSVVVAGTSAGGQSGPPASAFARRGSLPANHHSVGRKLSAYTVPSPPFAGFVNSAPPPPRRASLNAPARKAADSRDEEDRRRAELGRPRLGNIPSFGSESDGSGGTSDAGSPAGGPSRKASSTSMTNEVTLAA